VSFSELFALSSQIVRQFLAMSLMVYFFIEKFYNNKNRWWILIASVLIHTSSLFFLPIILLKKIFQKKIDLKKAIYILFIAFILSNFLTDISEFLYELTKGIPFINYIFERTMVQEITQSGAGIKSFIVYFLLSVMAIVAIYHIYFKKFNKRNIPFYNIYLILYFFILFTADQNLLSMRFAFDAYFFIPFFIPLIFSRKDYSSIIIRSIILIIGVARFFFELKYSVWEYATLEKIIAFNFFKFFS
jgi:hypothetical protein